MVLDPRDLLRPRPAAPDTESAPAEVLTVPLGGTRQERFQRLQIGGAGVMMMVLVIALADIVNSRAQETEANAVPEAAPTVVATATSAPSDPLVDAGVAPQLPAGPVATPTAPTTDPTGDVPPPSNVQNAPLQ
ncbi:hypothetical protein [Erythrobacter alti]|uniref:hypothetical protein n=1 Tax=Erythrobacter alti TaxID=1896145 RepID=UPI0030F425FF